MAYIRPSSHSIPLVMQIADDGHVRVYAKVLHACFGFHLSSIYIEEEVLSKSCKVDRSILQLNFCDDEGQYRLFPPRYYWAFRLNTTFMATSTDLVLQPSNMSSI
jgi:hypothetical protein